MGKMHRSKKYEQYYGQPYQPKTLIFVWVCPKCGWERPESRSALKCERCGTELTRITRKRKGS